MTGASCGATVLVCFAVPQEAKPFLKWMQGYEEVRCLITGMGARNAEASLRGALREFSPARVFSCGFAGALHPDLKIGDVICPRDSTLPGTKPVQFVCTERVVITVEEKAALRKLTGADAVEMESEIIARVCREFALPCQTVRVISDTAHEDLPIDFNALMTAEQKLSPVKLAWAIARAPQKIPALMRLGKHSAQASIRLAEALLAALKVSAE